MLYSSGPIIIAVSISRRTYIAAARRQLRPYTLSSPKAFRFNTMAGKTVSDEGCVICGWTHDQQSRCCYDNHLKLFYAAHGGAYGQLAPT